MTRSPASRIPSHGTTLFATTYAIDFVPLDEAGRSASLTLGSLVRPEPPHRFHGFGRPILAPADGVVIAVHDTEPDHDSYRGIPSVRYALTQHRRAAAGWAALAGNYVMIQMTNGLVVALCHLRRGSAEVQVGRHVRVREPLARCGNSGNSTEPHLHLQAIDRADIHQATAVPITFGGHLPRNRELIHAG